VANWDLLLRERGRPGFAPGSRREDDRATALRPTAPTWSCGDVLRTVRCLAGRSDGCRRLSRFPECPWSAGLGARNHGSVAREIRGGKPCNMSQMTVAIDTSRTPRPQPRQTATAWAVPRSARALVRRPGGTAGGRCCLEWRLPAPGLRDLPSAARSRIELPCARQKPLRCFPRHDASGGTRSLRPSVRPGAHISAVT